MRPMLMISLLVCGALVACSSGPSEGDIKKALQKMIDQTTEAAAANGMGSLFPTVKATVTTAKKLDCKSAGNQPGFVCDVQFEVSSTMGKTNNTRGFRFVKSSDGWVVME